MSDKKLIPKSDWQKAYKRFFILFHTFRALSFLYAFSFLILGLGLIYDTDSDILDIIGILNLLYFVFVLIFNIKFWLPLGLNRAVLVPLNKWKNKDIVEYVAAIAQSSGLKTPDKISFTGDSLLEIKFSFRLNNCFLPVKSNLLIGLPLLRQLNEDEFRCLITRALYQLENPQKGTMAALLKMRQLVSRVVTRNVSFSDFYGPIKDDFSILDRMNFGQVALFRKCANWMFDSMILFQVSIRDYWIQSEYESDDYVQDKLGGILLFSALGRQFIALRSQKVTNSYVSSFLSKRKAPKNLYECQFECGLHFFRSENATFQDGRMVVDQKLFDTLLLSEIVVDDPFDLTPSASNRLSRLQLDEHHPSTLGLPAIGLFKNMNEIEIRASKLFMYQIGYVGRYRTIEVQQIINAAENDFMSYDYVQIFNSCYNRYTITPFDLQQDFLKVITLEELHAIFQKEIPRLISIRQNAQINFSFLNELIANYSDPVSLSYRKAEFEQLDIQGLVALQDTISAEFQESENEVQFNFRMVYGYCYAHARNEMAVELKKCYENYFDLQEKFIEANHLIIQYNERAVQVLESRHAFDDKWQKKVSDYLLEIQPDFQTFIKEMCRDERMLDELSDEQIQNLKDFTRANWVFIGFYRSGVDPRIFLEEALRFAPRANNLRMLQAKQQLLKVQALILGE